MPENIINAFNVRVYGLLINSRQEILLTDEERFGKRMTKFPGGGLLFGEGPIDCMKREALEELGQEIEIIRHFYTSEYFQQSAFNTEHQLICIYYLCRLKDKENFRLSDKIYDFKDQKDELIAFRYQSIIEMNEDDLSFPVDKYVLRLLKSGMVEK
jgi:8-oxo-dGTP diphosphatase